MIMAQAHENCSQVVLSPCAVYKQTSAIHNDSPRYKQMRHDLLSTTFMYLFSGLSHSVSCFTDCVAIYL